MIIARVERIKIMNITSSKANCPLVLQDKHVSGFELYYQIRGVLDPSPWITNGTLLHISDLKCYDIIGGGIIIQLYKDKDYSNTKY